MISRACGNPVILRPELIVVQSKLFITTLFITAKFFTTSKVFAQMYQFSLNLSSLQQKFSLKSNYMGTNTVVVKKVDCITYFELSNGTSTSWICSSNLFHNFLLEASASG